MPSYTPRGWTSTSSSSAPPARCRPPTVRRPRCSSARGRTPALRLRRGHPAPAAALVARADRPPRGLPHPLPRRPLPRAARHAQDVRAARARGADHDPRPARARRPVPVAAADLRQAHLPVRARGAPSRRHARPRRLPAGHVPRRARRLSIGYALVEDERPGRFDVETADALGVPFGPERGALQRGEAVTLADGTRSRPEQVLGEARPGRTIVIPGDTAPDAVGPGGVDRRRPARPRGDLPRGRARARRRDGALDRASTRRSSPRRQASGCSRSRTSRRGTSGPTRPARPARSSPKRSCRGTSISSMSGFDERGGPRLIKGGRAPHRGDPAPVENSTPAPEQPVPEETAR